MERSLLTLCLILALPGCMQGTPDGVAGREPFTLDNYAYRSSEDGRWYIREVSPEEYPFVREIIYHTAVTHFRERTRLAALGEILDNQDTELLLDASLTDPSRSVYDDEYDSMDQDLIFIASRWLRSLCRRMRESGMTENPDCRDIWYYGECVIY